MGDLAAGISNGGQLPQDQVGGAIFAVTGHFANGNAFPLGLRRTPAGAGQSAMATSWGTGDCPSSSPDCSRSCGRRLRLQTAPSGLVRRVRRW